VHIIAITRWLIISQRCSVWQLWMGGALDLKLAAALLYKTQD
jgi:hypothetical protein